MDTNDFKKTLGRLISTLRRERGMSQEQLALEAAIDRSYMGAIERAEVNVTVDKLDRVARALDRSLGMLILEAEEALAGIIKRPLPRLDPRYLDETITLPPGITHRTLERSLNHALELLNRLPLPPSDLSPRVYSALVSRTVIKSLHTSLDSRPRQDDPDLNISDNVLLPGTSNGPLYVQATQSTRKGGESRQRLLGWLMIIVYRPLEEQTIFTQVKTALLERDDWVMYKAQEKGRFRRAFLTTRTASQRLREGRVYLDPYHVDL